MQSAIRLVDWFKHEATRIYATLDDDAETALYRKMAGWIREKHGGAVTAREYQQGHKRISTAAEAENELGRMAKGGFGEWDSTDRRKRLFRTH